MNAKLHASLVAAFVLSTARSAIAAPSDRAPPAAETVPAADLSKAKALFDAGGRAYDAGDFGAAIQAFEQAYAIAPRDGILFSIAQANRRQLTATNDRAYLERATALYRQYLAAVPSGGRRSEAVKALGELELLGGGKVVDAAPAASAPKAMKTLLAIDSPTPGAKISVDGGAAQDPQLTVEVAPGKHAVKITAPGFDEKVSELTAIAGQLVPARFELAEKPARLDLSRLPGGEVSVDGRLIGSAPFARPIELPSGGHFVSVARTGHQAWGRDLELSRGSVTQLDVALVTTTQRKVSYGLIGIGSASMIASAVLFGVSFAKESSAQSTLDTLTKASITPQERSDYAQAKSDRDGLRTAGAITLGGGAAVALVGVFLFAFDTPGAPLQRDEKRLPAKAPSRQEEHEAPEFSAIPLVGPGFGGAACSLRF